MKRTNTVNMAPSTDPQRPSLGPAGWFQRLAAGVYDGMIVIAIWMLVGFAVTAANNFEAVEPRLIQALVLGSAWLLYGFLWTKTGRTLGMQAWHLRVESQTGELMNWKQATSRFAWTALFCGGFWLGALMLGQGAVALGAALMVAGLTAFLSAVGEPDRRTWYDRLSGTRLVAIPKVKSGSS